jgi:hypothetical protein
MSIAGANVPRIDEALAPGSMARTRVDTGTVSNEITAPGSPLSASTHMHTQPMSFLAVSAEELTFQFSEATEAKETALEARLAREKQAKEKSNTIKVDEVQALMKLMEGEIGYEILRGQARVFAALYQQDPETAIKQLNLDNMPAEKKYALLSMALGTLGTTKNRSDTQASLIKHIQQQNNPFQEIHQLQIATRVAKKEVSTPDQNDKLTQLISMPPSIKAIWDLINEKSAGSLIDALQKTRLEWRESNISIIENVGAFILLHKIMTLIQTMSADTEKILTRIGVQEIQKTDLLQKYTKLLIDLAQSSMPSTLIERILVSLKSLTRRCPRCVSLYRLNCKSCIGNAAKCNCTDEIKCRCTDDQVYLLSVLHLHARGWPQDVWINSDAKNLTLDQLLKKQNAPSGLQAKRMIR